jgi:2,5-furandicarboxylate decarboxylase 1
MVNQRNAVCPSAQFRKQMNDLRTFLDEIKRNDPQQLLTISQKVSINYTATALAFELEKRGKAPVLIFENLEGFENLKLVANLFGSREMTARSVGVGAKDFFNKFSDCLDALVPAEHISQGPVHEIKWTGSNADLTKLPIPYHFSEDAGPYITAGMVAARDPDTGVGNLAYARLQVKGPQLLGASLHSRQHLWDYFQRAQRAGKDLPVAVVIGAHPAVMLAAAAKMDIDQDEYDLAGALMGQPLQLCRACTVDVDVPAHAEIIVEGYLLADTCEEEGPFGEYTGYTTGRSTNNAMKVTAITMRNSPIFVDIVPGNSSEHLILGGISKQAWVYKRMKEALPFFMDFHYPPSGTHFHAFVRINKTAEGQPQQAAQLMFGLDHYLKLIIVVDSDVDPTSESDVLWATATRMQADKDVSITPNSLCNMLDPSSRGGVGAKMMVDATGSMEASFSRLTIPSETKQMVLQLLEGN